MSRDRPTLSAREARWLAVGAQGLGARRPVSAGGTRAVRGVFDRLGVVQLDAINVLERTQFLTLFSRLGPYDVGAVHRLTGPGGALWEYWGHAASLLPVVTHPLLRWRIEEGGHYVHGPAVRARVEAWRTAHADYIAAVLDEVRDRGPLAASQLADPRRRDGEWWGRRSVGRQALEWLFDRGHVAAWRTPGFERIYDLPERVIPAEVLALPTPAADEAQRQLLLRAAGALGVATAADLGSYHLFQARVTKARVPELVEAGSLVAVEVEGWREEAYVLPGARPRRPTREQAAILSPFDSLVWNRDRNRRVFGFDYTIEVYVPAPKRRYGYYVLPVLLGDELVGRLDLKADRRASVLRVAASHLEAARSSRAGEIAAAVVAELDLMRSWLALDALDVAPVGELAPALLRAAGSRPTA